MALTYPEDVTTTPPPEQEPDKTPNPPSEEGGENLENDQEPPIVVPQPDPITDKRLGELQDRFAIIPLYTKHYPYAMPGEYMIDEHTGTSGIRLDNGKIIMNEEDERLRYHMLNLTNDISYFGMRQAIIKLACSDDDSFLKVYKSGTNLLEDPIYIDDQQMITRFGISLDIDILENVDGFIRYQVSYFDPDVIVRYDIDEGISKEFRTKLSQLAIALQDVETVSLAINEIILPSDIDCILEQCIIVVHSILIALREKPLD